MGGGRGGGYSDNGNWRGIHNLGQNNYHTIPFSSRKSDFYGHFQRKNSFNFYITGLKRAYVNYSLANFKKAATILDKIFGTY